MTLKDLLETLVQWVQEGRGEYKATVMIEHDGVQYHFPANDIAICAKSKELILMHESFNGEDLEDEPGVVRTLHEL